MTLGEKSFLAEVINKYYPTEERAYEIAEHFSDQQRKYFLALYYNKKHAEAKAVIENVKALQAHITQPL